MSSPDLNEPALTPDLEQAQKFLSLLDPQAKQFTFQTFDDNSDRKDGSLARILNGSLADHAQTLTNLQKKGAGVFVTINQTNLKGRKKENIVRMRALWQEDDGDGKPLPLQPQIVVQSSDRDRHHRYLLCNIFNIIDWEELQRRMVEGLGSDKEAKDVARVLRLPGFYHQKVKAAEQLTGIPFMVRIIDENAIPAYTTETLKQYLPALSLAPVAPRIPVGGIVVSAQVIADLRSALAFLRADERSIWVEVGYDLKQLGDVGRGLWLDWSMTSTEFQSGDALEWDTFKDSQSGYKNVFARAQLAGWQNVSSTRGAVVIPPAPLGSPALLVAPQNPFGFHTLSEVMDGITGTNHLIRPYIKKDAITMVFGASEAFKTFIVMDMGLHVAHGMDYHGSPIKKGAVFYICGEGKNGIGKRIMAWAKEHPEFDTDAPFYVSKIPMQMTDNLQAVQDSITALMADNEVVPALIIIDTLSANLGDGDENSNPDMGKMFTNLNIHFRAPFACSIIIVHHIGHTETKRERGAYALRANVDDSILLKRTQNTLSTIMSSAKVKDDEKWNPVILNGRKVELPEVVDDQGNTSDSLVFSKAKDLITSSPAALGKRQIEGIQVLAVLLQTKIDQELASGIDEPVVNILFSEWQDAYVVAGHPKKNLYDVRLSLVKNNKITVVGESITINGDPKQWIPA